MLHILIVLAVAAYGATAILVGAKYWRVLPQSEVDKAVAVAQLQVGPLARPLAPLVSVLTRPAWGAAHGLLWPLTLIPHRKEHR